MPEPIYGYGLCECGCGEKTTISPCTSNWYGWVKGEPRRFVCGHQSRKPGPRYVILDSGCWEWQHNFNKGGYPLWPTGRQAHRVMWEETFGLIPEGMHLHHRCRNISCVNPAHMEVISPPDHARRHARERTPITAEQVHAIRATVPWTRTTARELAARFGVSPVTVWNIRAGRTWSDA
jgi:hypothetical protein